MTSSFNLPIYLQIYKVWRPATHVVVVARAGTILPAFNLVVIQSI